MHCTLKKEQLPLISKLRSSHGHDVLLALEEPVAETKKEVDFIAGITCPPKLEAAKCVVYRVDTMLTDSRNSNSCS
jgi:hypothetical protein